MNDCNCNCPQPILPNTDCGFNGADKPGCSCGPCGKHGKKRVAPEPCPRKQAFCSDGPVVTFRKVLINAALGDDETGEILPENGLYRNSLVEYEANNTDYFYDSDGIYTKLKSSAGVESVNGRTGQVTITTTTIGAATAQGLNTETAARLSGEQNLQTQIDAIIASSDVKDIVGTYADLLDYDTSTLGDNDIVKVLADETRSGTRTYYRWSTTTSSWTYIGAEADSYTKAEADTKFVEFTDTPTLQTAGVIRANFNTFRSLTQAEYDALTTKDANTCYLTY